MDAWKEAGHDVPRGVGVVRDILMDGESRDPGPLSPDEMHVNRYGWIKGEDLD